MDGYRHNAATSRATDGLQPCDLCLRKISEIIHLLPLKGSEPCARA